jgi:hypothetical protein
MDGILKLSVPPHAFVVMLVVRNFGNSYALGSRAKLTMFVQDDKECH